jgi:hypothetical protein
MTPDHVHTATPGAPDGSRPGGQAGADLGRERADATPRRRTPRLSKSRFQSGLQCRKKLWLKCFEPRLADPIDETRQAIFDQGNRVGELARERFPDGVLVEEDYTQQAAALQKTRELIATGTRCLFEAAFEHDAVLVRADVIIGRPDGTWDLIEVKSTSRTKVEHITDVAIQAHVMEGAGLPVARAGVLHLNTSYVYEGGEYDLENLFKLSDITDEVRDFLPEIPALLGAMKAMLEDDCPDVQIGKHCGQPYECDFRGFCHGHLPDFPVTEIPRIDAELLDSLVAQGVLSMLDVPLDHPGLTESQAAICELVQNGEPRFLSGLGDALSPLNPPLSFLDFETVSSALPPYVGTRPYQALPVQWSCHTLRPTGEIEHREFLYEERSDPRRAFAESLIGSLPPEGRIVVYSSYENTILSTLATNLPDLTADLESIQGRLFDLLPVVRDYVRHPHTLGRNSLKYVLPALIEGPGYDGLAIQNGATASLRYAEALSPAYPDEARLQLFSDLREYCATDTLALVHLYQALMRYSAAP